MATIMMRSRGSRMGRPSSPTTGGVWPSKIEARRPSIAGVDLGARARQHLLRVSAEDRPASRQRARRRATVRHDPEPPRARLVPAHRDRSETIAPGERSRRSTGVGLRREGLEPGRGGRGRARSQDAPDLDPRRAPHSPGASRRRGRFIPLDPPSFLDHEGAQILLVGAKANVVAELGLALDPEQESEATAEITAPARAPARGKVGVADIHRVENSHPAGDDQNSTSRSSSASGSARAASTHSSMSGRAMMRWQ
jgi:hypothetical protein